MKNITSFLVAALAVLLLGGNASALETIVYHGTPVAPGRAMLELQADAAPAATLAAIERAGFAVTRVATKQGLALAPKQWLTKVAAEPATPRYVLATFDRARDLDEALSALEALPGVATAWPDQIIEAFFIPNDPLYNTHQRYLVQMFLENAWNTTKGAGVTVAVVDTGYLQDRLTDGAVNLLPGHDFANNDSDPDDTEGHGTYVGNIIAHNTNNGLGAAGAAPAVNLLPVKVFKDGQGGAYESDIVSGVDWAVEQGADVINMSLGGGEYNGVAAGANRDAVEAGVVVLAASGNDSRDKVSFPAAYSSVIAVGSCDTHSQGEFPRRSGFSNFGDEIEVVAPGNGIIAETIGSNGVGFYTSGGTSAASPHASAVAALIVAAAGGDIDPEEVRQVLQDTARRESSDWDQEIGYGEVDAEAAVESITGPRPNDPPVAGILADPLEGPAPLTVEFVAGVADPDGSIAGLMWSFSTGETFHQAAFTHVFEEPGNYTVLLSVTDNDGLGASADVKIVVTKGKAESVDDSKDEGGCGAAPAGRNWLGLLMALSLLLAWRLGARAAQKAST
jgi:serine protease